MSNNINDISKFNSYKKSKFNKLYKIALIFILNLQITNYFFLKYFSYAILNIDLAFESPVCFTI